MLALQDLLPAIASDGRMLARFKQEIQLSRKVSHPNVCPRLRSLARHPADGSAPATTVFLTMEFLPGETLSERLHRDGRLFAAEALPILSQTAEALDAAHRAGVIHRDFKPSNVMLVPTAGGTRAVVTDFGPAHSCEAVRVKSTRTLSRHPDGHPRLHGTGVAPPNETSHGGFQCLRPFSTWPIRDGDRRAAFRHAMHP